MSRVLTTDGLVRSVRTRGSIPSDTAAYTDEVIIDILNEEIDVGLLTKLMDVAEEHLVVYDELDIVPGQREFKVPYRAVGNKLRDVFLMDSAGNFTECTRISLEDQSEHSRYSTSSYNRLAQFFIMNDKIIFASTSLPNFSKVRMYYYMRPNKLVSDSEACQITSIDRVGGVVAVSNLPSTFSSLPQIDFIANKTPNKIISFDNVITGVSINTNPATFTLNPNLIPEELAVGDWIARAEETPIPNIPTEWQPVLAQRAVVFLMESMGDTEGLQNAQRKLAMMENNVQVITNDRAEGSPQKIRNRNGLLQSTFYRFRR